MQRLRGKILFAVKIYNRIQGGRNYHLCRFGNLVPAHLFVKAFQPEDGV